MSRPAERWLRHDHENLQGFADAMLACQGWAPSCSDHGECGRDGECFMPDSAWRAVRAIRAHAKREDNAGLRAGMERAALLLASELKGVRPEAPPLSPEAVRESSRDSDKTLHAKATGATET